MLKYLLVPIIGNHICYLPHFTLDTIFFDLPERCKLHDF